MSKHNAGPEFGEVALDALIGDTRTPAQLSALFRQMRQRLAERILAGDLPEQLGCAPGRQAGTPGCRRRAPFQRRSASKPK